MDNFNSLSNGNPNALCGVRLSTVPYTPDLQPPQIIYWKLSTNGVNGIDDPLDAIPNRTGNGLYLDFVGTGFISWSVDSISGPVTGNIETGPESSTYDWADLSPISCSVVLIGPGYDYHAPGTYTWRISATNSAGTTTQDITFTIIAATDGHVINAVLEYGYYAHLDSHPYNANWGWPISNTFAGQVGMSFLGNGTITIENELYGILTPKYEVAQWAYKKDNTTGEIIWPLATNEAVGKLELAYVVGPSTNFERYYRRVPPSEGFTRWSWEGPGSVDWLTWQWGLAGAGGCSTAFYYVGPVPGASDGSELWRNEKALLNTPQVSGPTEGVWWPPPLSFTIQIPANFTRASYPSASGGSPVSDWCGSGTLESLPRASDPAWRIPFTVTVFARVIGSSKIASTMFMFTG